MSRWTLRGSSRSASLKYDSLRSHWPRLRSKIRQRLKNPAAIRQELTCLLKVTHRGVVIPQAGVVVISLGQYGLAEIGLKSERGFGCLPRLFAEGDRWLKSL